ncbi:MAG: hypothetical protein K9M49_03545 [Candidatus Marinimicrobia bacterium]|nr:hypothetical protein [Candidatus Neomarinimicrobiota bacterium]MCF7851375.1 hypothetical protein [Candidatus Neomarinimicrobiota bacterium]MCF7904209.1 hypothetical protein [Candidatus Neomarinimicrobiota bacterium]
MSNEKCIWMEAGVVEYQLCPLKKNCDVCDFHEEMIRGCRFQERSEGRILLTRKPDATLSQFQPGLQYLNGHFWYKRVGDKRIRIGIDNFLWQLFTSVHKVVFPQNGGQIVANQCFCWMLLSGGMIYVKTPFSGKIQNINPRFMGENLFASQLYLEPDNELWLLELETFDEKLIPSLSRELYLQGVDQDCSKFGQMFHTEDDSEGDQSCKILTNPRNDFRKYLQIVSDGKLFIC